MFTPLDPFGMLGEEAEKVWRDVKNAINKIWEEHQTLSLQWDIPNIDISCGPWKCLINNLTNHADRAKLAITWTVNNEKLMAMIEWKNDFSIQKKRQELMRPTY